MLTLNKAIMCARNAADGVWSHLGPSGFTWLDALGPRSTPTTPRSIGHLPLAQFVAANPTANAEAMYRFAVADDVDARPWATIPRELRVALEVFRATFLITFEMYQADVVAARREAEQKAEHDGLRTTHMARSAFQQPRAFGARVPMSAPTPPKPIASLPAPAVVPDLEPKGSKYPKRSGGKA